MCRMLATLVAVLSMLSLAACGGSSSDSKVATLEEIRLSLIGAPESAELIEGTHHFRAQVHGVWSDGRTEEIEWSDDLSLTSLSEDVISIHGNALHLIRPGVAVLSLQYRGLEDEIKLEVVAKKLLSITVDAKADRVPLGLSTEVRVTGYYNNETMRSLSLEKDDVQVTSSSAVLDEESPGVWTFSPLEQGAHQIDVVVGDLSASVTVEATPAFLVGLQLTAERLSIAAGEKLKVEAIGRFSDQSASEISLETLLLDGTAEPFLRKGLFTTGTPGKYELIARHEDVYSSLIIEVGEAVLTSVAAFIDSSENKVPLGLSAQMELHGFYSDGAVSVLEGAHWKTSDIGVVSIDADGVITALGKGTADLIGSASGMESAAFSVIVTDAVLMTIEVQPEESLREAIVPEGTVMSLMATGYYSDLSRRDLTGDAVWSLSDSRVAAVKKGVVHAILAGAVSVRATYGGIMGELELLVVDAIPQELHLGYASPDGVSITMAKGRRVAVGAWVTYSDGTLHKVPSDQLDWSVEPEQTLAVDRQGRVLGKEEGGGTLFARFEKLDGAIDVEVSAAELDELEIKLDPQWHEGIPLGIPATFQVSGRYSDGGHRALDGQVTWRVDGESASIDSENGTLIAHREGVTRVHVHNGKVAAFMDVVLLPPQLQEIYIVATGDDGGSVVSGRSIQLRAEGLFSDHSKKALTNVQWKSEASVHGVVSETGRVTGRQEGSFTIVAQRDGLRAEIQLTVLPAELDQLLLTDFTLFIGQRQQLLAQARYSDGTMRSVDVTWRSDVPSIATIEQGDDGQLYAVGVTAGATKLSATLGDSVEELVVNVKEPHACLSTYESGSLFGRPAGWSACSSGYMSQRNFVKTQVPAPERHIVGEYRISAEGPGWVISRLQWSMPGGVINGAQEGQEIPSGEAVVFSAEAPPSNGRTWVGVLIIEMENTHTGKVNKLIEDRVSFTTN